MRKKEKVRRRGERKGRGVSKAGEGQGREAEGEREYYWLNRRFG